MGREANGELARGKRGEEKPKDNAAISDDDPSLAKKSTTHKVWVAKENGGLTTRTLLNNQSFLNVDGQVGLTASGVPSATR